MKPSNSLARLAARIDARERRERIVLGLSALVVLLVAWSMLVRAPLAENARAAHDDAQALTGEIAASRATHAQLQQQVNELEGPSGERATEKVRQRIDAVDRELAQRTARLISPDQMVQALRDVVNADAGVQLVRLENAGADPVISEEARSDDGDAVPRVYRHQVELVAEGRYLALLDYLQQLERLGWRFQWDTLALETQEYPIVRATVSLSTLSLAEDWIGV